MRHMRRLMRGVLLRVPQGESMFERYFVKPETIDRLRASWLGEPIERYVTWLHEHGYAARNVFRRVPLLRQFGEFAHAHGAPRWREVPACSEPLVTARV